MTHYHKNMATNPKKGDKTNKKMYKTNKKRNIH